ncbi:phage integrase SAM-like domain-containing protein [Sediminitomix flava]|uniref:Integrase-like protein n=1 Tax=Sediminitomix flava TaxID=379075 RepID=A0A315ZG92_SEDFL|nr:phage integrase SAM-like domain-containing protein [Sediminitomix flava]PWJ43878.1 integrase-like protein [Sediminitomix flava]
MAISIYFQLGKKEDKKGKDYVCMTVYKGRGKQFSCATGYKIHPKNWDAENQIARRRAEDARVINSHLDLRKDDIEDIYIKELEANLIDWDTFKAKAKFIAHKKNKGKVFNLSSTQIKSKQDFFQVCEAFLDIKGKIYSRNTIKGYEDLFSKLKEFEAEKETNIIFSQITLPWFDQVINFLIDSQLMNSSINNHLKNLKAFLNWASDRGYYQKRFDFTKIGKLPESEGDTIALNKKELLRLYEIDLSAFPHLEPVRDVFCFLCFTLQRYQSYKDYSPDQIMNNGTTWAAQCGKVYGIAYVPLNLFDHRAKHILEKYNYTLPEYADGYLNKEIKKICEMAGINEKVFVSKRIGNREIGIYKYKYEVISCHSARRTGVSLASEFLTLPQIQKITKHKSLKTLQKYINIDRESLKNHCTRVTLY